MCAVVVSIFAVCWAPYHIYFILIFHFPSIMKTFYAKNLYLSFYLLAMSNSCVNPIIYYWMNKRFRTYFNRVLCCIPCFLKQSSVNTYRRASSSLSAFGARLMPDNPRHQSCPIELNNMCVSQERNIYDSKQHIMNVSNRRRFSEIPSAPFLKADSHMSHTQEVLL